VYQDEAGSQLELTSCAPGSCRATAKTSVLTAVAVHDLFALGLKAVAGGPRILWQTVGPASLSTYLLACARSLCAR
jgi:hypothetical protein